MIKARNGRPKSTAPRKRYKNDRFLKALGENCRKYRHQKGYSIDRLAKESEQLSPATIDRLERGLADSQILVLYRYAEVLGIPLIDLFSFVQNISKHTDARIIPFEDGARPPASYVPVYPLTVAAGIFSTSEEAQGVQPVGWIDAGIRANTQDYFATFVTGDSMKPRIENGSLCLFKKYSGGTRQDRIYLIQARGLKNPETGESFVVKKYSRQTTRPSTTDSDSTVVIHLLSENPKYEPIVLSAVSDDDVQTLAEFIRVL